MAKAPQPLPPPTEHSVGEGLTLIEPITRSGQGPGLLVVVDDASSGLHLDHGVPSPLQKWGEEGYTVVEITAAALKHSNDAVRIAIEAIKTSTKYEPSKGFGIVVYDASLWDLLAPQMQNQTGLVAAVVYAAAETIDDLARSLVPLLVHAAGKMTRDIQKTPDRLEYEYPSQTALFASTGAREHFHYATEAISHTRSLTHLKKHMNGPYFDLEALWEEHTHYEFVVRDVEATMNTMVQEPYVNHVPTVTGGIGRKELADFYQNHFVFSNPKDTELELISRTVGIDRVVDEFIFKFTHDTVIDWLFPGIPPTGKHVEIPFMAVVNIRGDRLYHEHINWDHASALRQIGMIPQSLPYPDAHKANGVNGHASHHNEQMIVLPITGKDTAAKLRDKNAVKSNAMFTEAGLVISTH